MYARYPLFHSPIDLAHKHWKELIKKGDTVIDATCGNGHDTLILAELSLQHPPIEYLNSGMDNRKSTLIALDIQEAAIASTQKLLSEKLPKTIYEQIRFIQGCHSQFPQDIPPGTVKLIVYNFGYLPGGDKSKTTLNETTLQSLQRAQSLLQEGGVISMTCYPGHPEGAIEEKHLLEAASKLDSRKWSCCLHRWINRTNAPSLILIQKEI